MWRRETGWVKGLGSQRPAFRALWPVSHKRWRNPPKIPLESGMPARKKSSSGKSPPSSLTRLEDLPNIGKSLAADLRAIGIVSPADPRLKQPRVVFQDLVPVMGHRHDPCVFYTLLAVNHFLKSTESLPWWKFTEEGKRELDSSGPSW